MNDNKDLYSISQNEYLFCHTQYSKIFSIQLGISYGRRMTCGYLNAKYPGRRFGETRVGKALKEANPENQELRRQASFIYVSYKY